MLTSDQRLSLIRSKLADQRGKRVIFLSHCLLNENTRYPGGAFRRAGVDEWIDLLQARGIGIVQMQCPEQKAWGGVLKKHILRGYGIKGSLLYMFRKPYLRCLIWKTRRIYRKIAGEIVKEIIDYQTSGFDVIGVVGIKGSPSCGVTGSLDLERASKFAANLDLPSLTTAGFNDSCYRDCLTVGPGIFMQQLTGQLKRAGRAVPILEHDLLEEMRGKISTPLAGSE